jgi:Phospholipid N-methyltransferase
MKLSLQGSTMLQRLIPKKPLMHIISHRHIHLPFSDKIRLHAGFIGNFVRAPRQTGSICPSSHFLVEGLLRALPKHKDGLVIDLGSGTGIVTEALLKKGVTPEQIIAVECCESFACTIRQRYPNVCVFADNACKLGQLIDTRYAETPVRAIVSSLPFRSIPHEVCAAIAGELIAILQAHGGRLIQYSYAWWSRYPLAEYGFVPRFRYFVPRNVPPAIVEVYTAPHKKH